MIDRPLRALLAATLAGSGMIGPAAAQGTPGSGGPSVPAPRPAADTRAPGATATQAITDPARVPPGEKPAGGGTPASPPAGR